MGSDLAGAVVQPLRPGLQGHEQAQVLLCPAQMGHNFTETERPVPQQRDTESLLTAPWPHKPEGNSTLNSSQSLDLPR